MEKKNRVATLPQPNPMCGGDGPHSYARNSSYQKAVIDCAKTKIKEVILEKLDLAHMCLDLNTFKIADFGCSVGPNTFDVVQTIVETVKRRYEQQNIREAQKHLEFHVFFNDQSNNDFNTLFKNRFLSVCKPYFIAGVPGSFYDRVLPRNTINIGHTSYTLHWLSKIPKEVCNINSLGRNKHNISCSNLVEEMSKAYKSQFEKDMGDFLGARAEELVSEGFMIMSGMCLPDGVPMVRTWKGVAIDTMRDCLIDMANSRILNKERVESFSLPLYFPHMSELEEVIKQNECFSIEVLERMIHPMEDLPLTNDFIASTYRAIFHGLIEEFFGDGVVDELFDRFAKRLETHPIDFQTCVKDIQYFVLLKRNSH
ncbi:PREDICTED: probable S-adenosylmethionine-dependent methyltransferase At5g37990 [Tarenaya hassleriana]|uniref:probable S-adenosylmethionine-dependent methyltransferase At5g37990 n=1 Tax=Tarenaya hassleriana TaxID=28532 RepID=UPI00053C44A4|nr:PREDICTED: probable S-adenosylmethionine-dependent methyltransferase At5g37990 [Tarenaya hassleriana]